MKTFDLMFFCSMTLVGCGGGAAYPTVGPWSANPPVCTTSAYTVNLFGDSTMIGVGQDLYIVAQRPANILQGLLDAKYGTCFVGVIDRAGGATAQALIGGTDIIGKPLATIPPANVNVFNFGLNDANDNNLPAYTVNLHTLAIYGSATGSKNIFETAAAYIQQPYTNAMLTVAAAHGLTVADLHAYSLTVPDLYQHYFPSGVHGTQAWYVREVTDVLAPAVEAELQKISGFPGAPPQ